MGSLCLQLTLYHSKGIGQHTLLRLLAVLAAHNSVATRTANGAAKAITRWLWDVVAAKFVDACSPLLVAHAKAAHACCQQAVPRPSDPA